MARGWRGAAWLTLLAGGGLSAQEPAASVSGQRLGPVHLVALAVPSFTIHAPTPGGGTATQLAVTRLLAGVHTNLLGDRAGFPTGGAPGPGQAHP